MPSIGKAGWGFGGVCGPLREKCRVGRIRGVRDEGSALLSGRPLSSEGQMNHASRLLLPCVLIATYGISTPVALAADTEQATIAPQALGDALEEWAIRHGKQLMYDSDLTAGVTTRGVPAGLSETGALSALLDGTGLVYRVLNNRTISIFPKAASAPPPRSLPTSGYLPTGLRLAQNEPGAAGEAWTPERQKEPVLEEIVLTGTRITQAAAASALPTVVMKREEIDRTGAANLAELTRFLTQSTGSPRTETNALFTGAARSTAFDLRGLGTGRTLTLLNGRRIAASALNSARSSTSTTFHSRQSIASKCWRMAPRRFMVPMPLAAW